MTILKLKPSEKRLIEFLRTLNYGQIELVVQAGLPCLIRQAVKTIRLASNGKIEEENEKERKT